jgi:peptidoglycan/xylan/chitin deacetylase (PgdA/CDA1 family)
MLALLFGLLAATQSPKLMNLPPQTVVLTYHDIIEKRDDKALWFDCTGEELRRQLAWMKARGCHFISIFQLYRHLTKGEKLPFKAVLLTFADNYLGFYSRGLPILRELKIPSVMFVHTDFVGSKVGRPKMNWDQLIELDRGGLITIASQTRTHPADLRQLSGEQLRWEFVGSRRVLEAKLGHPVHYLAYPNGKFDRRVSTFAEAAGYTIAFTEEQRPAESAPNLFEIPRYVHTKYKTALLSISPAGS